MNQNKVTTAVIPVGGFGTRCLPGSKAVPKEMLNLVDRPVIAYIVEEARAAGIDHIIFVTGRGKHAIEDYFDHNFELEGRLNDDGKVEILDSVLADLGSEGEMSYTRQQYAKGLGHAILCAEKLVGGKPFAVLLPDMVVDAETGALKQLLDVYDTSEGNVVGSVRVPDDVTHRYGILALGEGEGKSQEITGMVEKPRPGLAPSNLAIAGRYILQPEIFDILRDQHPGAGGEIQLTDAMQTLLESQHFTSVEYDGVTHDCGDKVGLLMANVSFAMKRDEFKSQIQQGFKALIDKA